MDAKLSPAQTAALAKLTNRWQSAYYLQVSRKTLDALVRRGLAESKGHGELGAMSFPSTTIKYRLKAAPE